MKIGFDNAKYLKIQSEHIKERIAQFGDKLYLEFGGKLFDDYHASRVLPGFAPDAKLQMLMQLSEYAEIVIVISAADIEKNKIHGDLGITYDVDVLRLHEEFQKRGLYVGSVVITHYTGQISADQFKARLEKKNIRVYLHYTIEGYPANVPLIVSENGYGKNDYIKTSRPLVVITAPGPGSGKMATCLSQLYHDGLMEAVSVKQTEVFEAAVQFARVEGILPAPESSHAIRVAIDEALKCRQTGEEKTIVFGLTGTGYFDMMAYEKHNNGTMADYIPTDDDLKPGLTGIPRFPGNEF